MPLESKGPKAASKQLLIDQLLSVFLDRGYEGATITQLAHATGLGKASLYHHFPGGKDEMVSVLLRHAVARLHTEAFRRLNGKKAPQVRLNAFVDGFSTYVQDGTNHCLVAVLGQGSASATHGALIAQQLGDWTTMLAATLGETGMKRKKARRAAEHTLAGLYGGLLLARLHQDPAYYRRAAKRVRQTLSF